MDLSETLTNVAILVSTGLAIIISALKLRDRLKLDGREGGSQDAEYPLAVALTMAGILAACWIFALGGWFYTFDAGPILSWLIVAVIAGTILLTRIHASMRESAVFLAAGCAMVLAFSPSSYANLTKVNISASLYGTLVVFVGVVFVAWLAGYRRTHEHKSEALPLRALTTWALFITLAFAIYGSSGALIEGVLNDDRAPISSDSLGIRWPSLEEESNVAFRLASELRLIQSYRENAVNVNVERILGEYARKLQLGKVEDAVDPVPLAIDPDDFLPQVFALLTLEDQRKFLRDRLNWVHPLPSGTGKSQTAPLSGLRASERFEVLGNARAAAALLLGVSADQYFRTYHYTPDVRRAVKPSEQSQVEQGFYSLVGISNANPLDAYLPLYRNLGFEEFSTALQQQMAVDHNVEAWIIQNEYLQFAVRHAQVDLDESSRGLIPTYLTLHPDVQMALATQVFNQNNYVSILRSLKELHKSR